MSKVMIEMEDEQVDSIVVQEIKNCIKGFERDLELRTDGKGLAIFDNDPVKDVLYIQEHISAFKLVVKCYGG